MIRTPAQLLAIAGLGFVLATGHTLFRSIVMDKAPVVVVRQVRTAETPPIGRDDAPADQPQTPQGETPPDRDPPSSETTDAAPDSMQASSPLDEPVKEGSITLREAFALFQDGAFFLDARYQSEFERGHIEGAIWMPASRVVTSEGQEELNFIPPGGIVVIYCTGGDCDASENTAIRIEQLQYDFDIRILGKGYEDWANAGLPVEGTEVTP
ncbi:MAG: rhodanese-like domain-containing protein [Planctomycetota bacterium]|nr:MAG: rhodanese-like domain-containing protein [Planctomycetota bacterium]